MNLKTKIEKKFRGISVSKWGNDYIVKSILGLEKLKIIKKFIIKNFNYKLQCKKVRNKNIYSIYVKKGKNDIYKYLLFLLIILILIFYVYKRKNDICYIK